MNILYVLYLAVRIALNVGVWMLTVLVALYHYTTICFPSAKAATIKPNNKHTYQSTNSTGFIMWGRYVMPSLQAGKS